MATVVLSPIGNGVSFLGLSLVLLNGGFINTYQAGTNTPLATYTTSVGNVANSNPIILNADGRPPQEIWLIKGSAYKFVVSDALSNVIATYDNIPGINDVTAVGVNYQYPGAGSVVRTSNAKMSDYVSFKDFGAVGDGATNDTAVINTALALGKPLDGGGLIYAVAGNITLPAGADIRSATFIQLTPGAAGDVRTLTSASVDNIKLRQVKVLRNGNGTNGQIALDAGIWIEGGSGHLFEDVEVSGDDIGSGIVFNGCSNFVARNLYAHDINYLLGADPLDDRVQGIWFNGCSDFVVITPKAKTLGGNFGSGATTRYSRGLAFSGNSRFDVYGAAVRDVDQGVDCTGSAGNSDFSFHGGVAYQCNSFGFKASTADNDGRWIGTKADKCGYAGHVVSGPGEAGDPNIENLTFIGCLSKSIGYNGNWTAQQPAGFLILQGSFALTYPRGVRFIACEAIDEQGVPTMYDGFRNQVPVTGDFNEAIHCTSRGHTHFAYNGMNAPHVRVSRNAVQNIGTAAWTAVIWTVEDADFASMHETSANQELVTIQRQGLYSLKCQLYFAPNATGSRRLRFILNGATITPSEFGLFTPTAGSPSGVFGSVDLYLKRGDILRVEGWQDSGGNLDIRSAESFWAVTEMGGYGATG